MKFLTVLSATLCAASLLLPTKAFAWADGGHKTVALIAWEKLDTKERKWIADLLKQHPTYDVHFAAPMKEELGEKVDEASEQRFLFAQASIWPDMIRPPRGSKDPNPYEQYHRPLWHYVDIPILADESTRSEFRQPLVDPNFEWKPGGADFLEINLNAAQVLLKALHDIHDTSIPAPKRAVMVCWLFHVLGDVHQPCHSAALFVAKKLWTGDRGANGVSIKGLPTRPLHAYWDGLPGAHGTDLAHAYDNARAWLNTAALKKAGEDGASVSSPEAWVRESWASAKQNVYPPYLIKAIGEAKSAFYSKDGQKFYSVTAKVDHDDLVKYEANALAVAKERVVIAGYRLAEAVKKVSAPEK